MANRVSHMQHNYPNLRKLARNNLEIASFLQSVDMHIADEFTVEKLIFDLATHNNELMEKVK